SISFSTDSQHLYDMRGRHGHVWELNALVRVAETSEFAYRDLDSRSDNHILSRSSTHTKNRFNEADKVTTIAGQPTGSLYCYGTMEGLTALGEVGYGIVCELESSEIECELESFGRCGFAAPRRCVAQVAWSDNGSLVAIAHDHRWLSVHRTTKGDNSEQRWRLELEFRVEIASSDACCDLLFQHRGHRLFAAARANLSCIDLANHAVQEMTLPNEEAHGLKWICHPTRHDYLLAFRDSACWVYTWDGLIRVAVYLYQTPTELKTINLASSKLPSHTEGNFGYAQPYFLGHYLACCVNSCDILLGILLENKYLLFSADDIQLEAEESTSSIDDTQSHGRLGCTIIPQEISRRARVPLALLSRRRFMFLDVDGWICTWRIPTASQEHRGMKEVEAHYFLPGDWLNPTEVDLYTSMPDGTLLAARKKEVGAVQCAKIQRG
ncbi:hypothetical protein IMZ48_07455, partial [Candidatus Bathyarchaeota archaeon]|nr:hypothetical protein [Candidatus Bathyarchaeota archaeon]